MPKKSREPADRTSFHELMDKVLDSASEHELSFLLQGMRGDELLGEPALFISILTKLYVNLALKQTEEAWLRAIEQEQEKSSQEGNL